MSPRRQHHSGAMRWAALDHRRSSPPHHPGFSHPDNSALGQFGGSALMVASPRIIAEWAVNRRERVRVSIEQYNGTWLINVRKWFEADDGTVRPGKQGIALGIKHLPQLAEAMTQARLAATKDRLIQPPAAERHGSPP
jgi:Transcriptional Coactivator p15 (PC4)